MRDVKEFAASMACLLQASVLGYKGEPEGSFQDHMKRVLELLPRMVDRSILEEVKEELLRLKPYKEGDFKTFYICPPGLFEMVRFLALHLGLMPHMPGGLKWSDKKSLELHRTAHRPIRYLNEFRGPFREFSRGFLTSEAEKTYNGPKPLTPEYLLKYYAYISLDFPGEQAAEIDGLFRKLSERDRGFDRYFSYKLFLMKMLACLGLAKPEILMVKEARF